MLLSAALISLAIMAPSSEPQSAAPDASRPYSLEGVRKAASRPARSSVEPGPVERRASQYRLAIDTQQATSSPCSQLVIVCQPAWKTGGAATWNDEFLGMTNPILGSPYTVAPGNKDRAMAAASSVGFAMAFQGVANLVRKVAVNSRQNKVKKIRREIAAELEALERAHEAARKAAGRPDPEVKHPLTPAS